jgi:hypothetical protein
MHFCPGNTFKSITEPETQGQFLSDCKKVNGTAELLRSIVSQSQYKKDIKLHFYHSTVSPSTYLVMVHLKNDATAIKLAKMYNFPRGFPVIWIPSKTMYLYGFHPKFANDRKQIDNIEEFEGAEKLQVMLKFSGFLAQFIVWEAEGRLYWTVTSKNAVDNEFHCYVADILRSWITSEQIKRFHTDGIYFCGEAMSQRDQTHGARVLKEGFITTCVGKFTKLRFTCPALGAAASMFLNILSHDEMYHYSKTNGLPVSDILTVEGQDAILEFAKKLAQKRDFMSMDEYRRLTTGMPCLEGTIGHETILGNILEGLVIWIYKNNACKTIKYKFPIYTTRTFGLRAFLSTQGKGSEFISVAFKNHVDKYLDFWVTSTKGKEFWKRWFYKIALNGQCMAKKALVESGIGEHILLADAAGTDVVTDAVKSTFMTSLGLKDDSECPMSTVIVIVGPIGAGKSSYGRFLSGKIPNGALIDGDSPPPYSSEITKVLGQERGPVTLWAIIKAIYEGYVPILTAGGGVLFSGMDLILKDRLMTMLGRQLNLVLYLPCESTPEQIDTFYQDWSTDNVIKYRLESGLWKSTSPLKQFLPQIQKLSRTNVKFAKLLLKKASIVYTYRPLQGHGDVPTSLDGADDHADPYVDADADDLPESIQAGQVRLITHTYQSGRNHYGHITIVYTTKLHEVTDHKLVGLKQLIGTKYVGIWISANGWGLVSLNSKKLAEALTEIGIPTDPEELHITVNAGKHYPSLMRSACKQFLSNSEEITLATKTLEEIVYPKNKMKTQECQVEILDVCCI